MATRTDNERRVSGLVALGAILIVAGVALTIVNVWLGLAVALAGFILGFGFAKQRWY